MQLTNTLTVALPVGEAWTVLTDLERVAPCMSGAAVTSVDGDDHHWAVKVKVGPVSSKYEGVARFLERDEAAHRAVIEAKGRDAGGQGNVAATVTATLSAHGDGTLVRIDTDLAMSGRVAQFGRGVIADVSGKLFDQFAKQLEAEVTGGGGPDTSSAPPPREVDDVVDLAAMSRGAVLERFGPALGAFVLGAVLMALVQRLRVPRSGPPAQLGLPPWAAGYPPYPPYPPAPVPGSLPAERS